MSKNKFYFQHGWGARNNTSIIDLRIKYGTTGYGLFLMIVEILIENKLKITQSKIIDILKAEGETDETLILSILNDFDLFNHEKNMIELNCSSFTIIQKFLTSGRLFYTDKKKWKLYRDLVFKRDNYTCQYCKATGVRLELDHIIPFSKGGEDILENLTAACFSCNRKKSDKSVKEFMQWLDQQKKE